MNKCDICKQDSPEVMSLYCSIFTLRTKDLLNYYFCLRCGFQIISTISLTKDLYELAPEKTDREDPNKIKHIEEKMRELRQ